MGKFIALNDQFRESVQTETPEQETHRRNHGHDSEISWCE